MDYQEKERSFDNGSMTKGRRDDSIVGESRSERGVDREVNEKPQQSVDHELTTARRFTALD